MPGPHKGVSTQHTNQQVLAKSRHQPSERDQQAREKLRQKAKINSHAYIQLGEKVLQTVHQTFETLQRIHRQYVRYESALDDTLIGIENLNSGYLMHHIQVPGSS